MRIVLAQFDVQKWPIENTVNFEVWRPTLWRVDTRCTEVLDAF